MNEEKDEELYSEEELLHYGTPRHSGRYPWGSGENPYQRSGDFLSRVDQLKSQGLTETQIAEAVTGDYRNKIEELRKSGVSEDIILEKEKNFKDISTTRLRAMLSLAKEERRSDLISKARTLKEEGLNNVQIAAQLGLKGESSVRSLLNADSEARMKISEKTADFLRDQVDSKGMIDVGTGVERTLNISKEKMNQSLEILKLEGYEVYGGRVPQATNKGKYTTLKVLCPPGTQHSEIFQYDKINTLQDYISRDNGETFESSFVYPKSMDSSRIAIRYSEDGGSDKDGVVEIRRGVQDLSLGNSTYSQVRILVDDTHYIKGMALYSDNMPDGIDLVFNTNKTSDVSKMDVLKKIKDDPDNPFGSSIKEHGGQSYFIDENGVKQLSLINKRSDEGDWGDWSKEISAQFLSKQPMKLINKQIGLSMDEKQSEFDEINSLTNPTVKRALLMTFADDCDASAVSLKAASLPGATYKVILPITSLKDSEVYAPHLQDGSRVALVRYPHGGIFEIPTLTVNNRNPEGRDILTTNPSDAIGINSKVASILSGADFDGDTVMVIPLSDKVRIKSSPPLKQLEGFDPKLSYGADEIRIVGGQERYFRGGKAYSILSESRTQLEMGVISNLLTDMTLKGANDEEIARAVKHSMVIIDANKHKLDYKQSAVDNGVRALHKKYQTQIEENGDIHEGASTLISKSKSSVTIAERKEGAFFAKDTGNELVLIDNDNKLYLDPTNNKVYSSKEKVTVYTDPVTGEKLWHDTNRTFTRVYFKGNDGTTKKASVITKDNKLYYKDEDGNYIQVTDERLVTEKATTKSTKMTETSDARTLSSGTPQEEAYAEYANKLKSLANEARKEILIIKDIPYSPSARQTYDEEVISLNQKRNQAVLNAPKERHAQTLAATIIKAKKQDNPSMTTDQENKLRQQEIRRAREKVGAKRTQIQITNKEWEAIQAGAISSTQLKQILTYADLDVLRQLAMPRATTSLSANKIRRLKNMAASGYTTSEIAKALGISPSTVSKYLKGDE